MAQGCVEMDWREEIYWSFIGATPFLGAAGLAGRAIRDPDEFTAREAVGSIGGSLAIGYALMKFVPSLREGYALSTMTTMSSLVRFGPWALYGLGVYAGSSYLAKKSTPKLEKQLGQSNVQRGFEISRWSGGLAGPIG